jgi:hypothetical protein
MPGVLAGQVPDAAVDTAIAGPRQVVQETLNHDRKSYNKRRGLHSILHNMGSAYSLALPILLFNS